MELYFRSFYDLQCRASNPTTRVSWARRRRTTVTGEAQLPARRITCGLRELFGRLLDRRVHLSAELQHFQC